MPYADQVDAEPVRQHVSALLASGMTVVQIQNLSGVDRTAIRVLLGDFPNRKPSRQVRALTASRLLRTRLDLGSAIDGLVPSIGTRRRLQALQAIGWPALDLARQLGRDNGNGLQVARHPYVRASTAQVAADLYVRLSDVPGPSTRVREQSLGRGWLPPIWWDDDTIDAPNFTPDTKTYVYSGRILLDDVALARHERVRIMSRLGMPVNEIAARIGTKPKYVRRDRLEHRILVRDDRSPYLTADAPIRDVDEVAVRRIIAGALIVPRHAQSVDLIEAIRRLASEGHPDGVIGDCVGRSKDAVLKIRVRHNITAGAPLSRATDDAIAAIASSCSPSEGGRPETTRRHPAA